MAETNEELRSAGLKVTLPRIKILELLEAAQEQANHVSAEDIYRLLLESGNDVGIATVYRVLTQFETAGLVTRHNFESGHSVYELTKGDHHDHMVCIDSGEVIEFTDEIIEKRQKKIAEENGYELIDHSLILYVRKKSS